MRGQRRNIVYFILLAGLLAIVLASIRSFNVTSQPTDKSLSEFISAIDQGIVRAAVVKGNGTEVDWDGTDGKSYKTTFREVY
ncbi:MAG TPA: ATP-dependent metallopeptidase FtsH/Yme1/Tma family protein, partial [Candidatus Limnocylindria bacterium]|nr:ATP-dependent metallopeptidase FtsH/Yme1/Tma family protein [Candidatus Limnocylindria bacterium]